MTEEEQKEMFRAIGSFVHEQIQKAVVPLQKEISDLKARQKQVRYTGVWTEKTPYWAGNFVTHDGSVWHCNIDGIETRPGKDPVGWTLAVKRGKDMRDAA
jgi:hypothetical protein